MLPGITRPLARARCLFQILPSHAALQGIAKGGLAIAAAKGAISIEKHLTLVFARHSTGRRGLRCSNFEIYSDGLNSNGSFLRYA